jgi:hypothetical protein
MTVKLTIKALDGAFFDIARRTDVRIELPHPSGRRGGELVLRKALRFHHLLMLRFGICRYIYYPGKFGDKVIEECNIYA